MCNHQIKYVLCLVLLLLLGRTNYSVAATRSEAFVGQPFGVGRITVDVLRGEPSLPLEDERFTVRSDESRVMLPVLKEEPVRRILRRLLKVESPRSVTVYYLFSGNEPFDLLSYSPNEQAIRVRPQVDTNGHRRLLGEWWKQYSERWQRLLGDPQYPPIAENFLVSTFARRLKLPIPKSKQSILPWKKQQEKSVFDELLVSESYKLHIDREMIAGDADDGHELQELPEPETWQPFTNLQVQEDEVGVEPIAKHVPEECFYIRFGNFSNYFWFRDLNKKWQGDLGNMIARRGIKRAAADRIQQQLSVRESAFAKLLGPKVIADAALIGLDPYVAQGAGIGILFQAKNNFLVTNDMMNQRRGALKLYKDAKESTVELAGQKVSLVESPEGRVRSYYVQSGDFHLVTSSRALAKRFIEAGQGDRSLASLASFRNARRKLPLEREDTVFAFVSEKFFQNLCSPQYFIENRRRVRSAREPRLLELAQRLAIAEGNAAATNEQLIESSILPANFANRVDSSELTNKETGWIDSRRGGVGYFKPVADVMVNSVTSSEVSSYKEFIRRYKSDVGQMPPIAIGVQRVPDGEGNGETMVAEAVLAGVGELNLGKFKESLGKPTDQQLTPIEGDVISGQAVLNIDSALIAGGNQEHTLFGVLQDFRSPLLVQRGAVVPGAPPAELVRGYLGAWPRPGLLQIFTGPTPPAGEQPEQAKGPFWQAKSDDFFLLTFKPDVAEQVLPQLQFEPAERPAQIRLRIDDLTGKELSNAVNALGFKRARETSVAASRLMNALANQLHVPRDECRDLAERLVDGKFLCPLGGEYQLYAPDLALETWASSALSGENRHLLTEIPEDFQLPMLTWFRGLQGDMVLDEESLRVHLEIKMTEAAVP